MKYKSNDPLIDNLEALEEAKTSDFAHELSFLGTILLDNDLQLEATHVRPEFFLNAATRQMADAIWSHLGENRKATAPLIGSALSEELSRLPFIAIESADSGAFENYGAMVRERYVRHEAMDQISKFRNIVHGSGDDIWAAIGILQSGLEAIADEVAISGSGGKRQDLDEMIEWIRKAQQSDNGLTGVPTGYDDLDRDTGGWQNGDLIIKAARPGVGKTSDVIRSVMAAACSGYPSAMASLEMTNVQVLMKMASLLTGISYSDLRRGKVTAREEQMLDPAVAILEELPIYLIDGEVNFYSIRDRLRTLSRTEGIRMAAVDYLQLCEGGINAKSREQEVSFYSRSFKRMAKDTLGIPMQVLSQLSRNVDKRSHRIPNLSDLRESGAIEQDADMVAFLHRPGHYESSLNEIMESGGEDVDETEAYFIKAKDRHGAIKTYRRHFVPETGDFCEIEYFDGSTDPISFRSKYFPNPKEGDGPAAQLQMEVSDASAQSGRLNTDEDIPF